MKESQYWDGFYEKVGGSALKIPSQFCVFVVNEFHGVLSRVVELGCGNGRDALFFARSGFDVYGVDSSQRAINICSSSGFDNAIFECHDISSPNFEGYMSRWVSNRPFILYSRFFLHAINDELERSFFYLAKQCCVEGSVIAVEFRTYRDEGLSKITEDHYRRYMNPLEFIRKATDYGFKVIYFIEGFGYAKYKSDDAHVARVMFCRK
jgi:methylase of polypeptide subunit release factors